MKMQNSCEKLDYSRSAAVADFFQTYFEAKSGRDLEGATRHFSQDAATYSDVTMGWVVDGSPAIHSGFAARMRQPGDSLSYLTMIMGDITAATGASSSLSPTHPRSSEANSTF